MDELVRAAQALSDPTRVRVLNLMIQRECCVCEVMDVLGISQVNASRYCNALKDAGFLEVRRDGRWRHYSVSPQLNSPSLKNMLHAVEELASTDPQLLQDVRRLLCSGRRCIVPSPTPDMCDACNARVAVAGTTTKR
ncbi:MAG: winged helix-turn-helix transcriptional regulator [Dehalococcoidia bacterium]|nr:winged helix-turn-helix transcriptional regulator [Dehalococcoidia bacterium]